MRKALVSICMIFCMVFAMQTAPIFEYTTIPVVQAKAGVEDIWGEMEITEEGTFDPGTVSEPTTEANMGKITEKYKAVAQFVIGLMLITAFFGMIIQFTRLSTAGDNEMARRNAMKGILVCGIGIFLMGASEIVISIFWTALAP